MNARKPILIAATLMVLAMGFLAFKPGEQFTDITERTNMRFTQTTELPFSQPFTVSGLAVSGSWMGNGFAQAWLIGQGEKHLILDTDTLDQPQFTLACEDSCKINPLVPEKLLIVVTGGQLAINDVNYAVPFEPAGMALCPNCRKVSQKATPDHGVFMIVILLFISVIASQALTNTCSTSGRRKMVTGILVVSFLVLTTVFGVSVAAPTSELATTAKQGASVIAALGVLALFSVGIMEIRKRDPPFDPQSKIWNALEEAEDEWEKRK